jgi:hypothetical protein
MELVRAKRHTPVGLSAKAKAESISASKRILFIEYLHPYIALGYRSVKYNLHYTMKFNIECAT